MKTGSCASSFYYADEWRFRILGKKSTSVKRKIIIRRVFPSSAFIAVEAAAVSPYKNRKWVDSRERACISHIVTNSTDRAIPLERSTRWDERPNTFKCRMIIFLFSLCPHLVIHKNVSFVAWAKWARNKKWSAKKRVSSWAQTISEEFLHAKTISKDSRNLTEYIFVKTYNHRDVVEIYWQWGWDSWTCDVDWRGKPRRSSKDSSTPSSF